MTGGKSPLVTALPPLLARGKGNAWMTFERAEVYLRVTRRIVDGAMIETVDIANVNVAHQGKGTFTRMIATIESMTDRVLYLENVLHPAWAEALVQRHGWRYVSRYDSISCLILSRSERGGSNPEPPQPIA